MDKFKDTYNKLIYLWLFLTAFVLIGLDQYFKHLAVSCLKGKGPLVLINGVLELLYLENQGAAFGMLQNKQVYFAILTIVFVIVCIFLFIRIPKNKYYLPMLITVAVLFAGAIGNFIDRLSYKYVVDFIYFCLIDFPIFNFADICVSIGVVALIVLILFKYKDNDFEFLSLKRKES